MIPLERVEQHVDPAMQATNCYCLQTVPLVNSLRFPVACRQINQIFINVGPYQFLLQPVELSVDMAAIYPQKGRPSFYQVAQDYYGFLCVLLWPVPDAAYDLEVFVFMETPPSVSVAKRPEDKAHLLLCDWLTPIQLSSLLKYNYFLVTGSASGKRYRVNNGNVFNVDELGADDKPVRKLCFTPHQIQYSADVMLAQKITLETDEKRALTVANKQNILTDAT